MRSLVLNFAKTTQAKESEPPIRTAGTTVRKRVISVECKAPSSLLDVTKMPLIAAIRPSMSRGGMSCSKVWRIIMLTLSHEPIIMRNTTDKKQYLVTANNKVHNEKPVRLSNMIFHG